MAQHHHTRIRVILGDDGNEWLLLLNHTDGFSTWQTQHWKAIPSGLATQISDCKAKGGRVKDADFGPYCSWFVHDENADGSGGLCWWDGLDSELSDELEEAVTSPHSFKVALGSLNSSPSLCTIIGTNGYSSMNARTEMTERIDRIHSRNGTVNMIRLFANGEFYMNDNGGSIYALSNTHLIDELKKRIEDDTVEDLAVAADGSWIVIRSNYFVASRDVDTELIDLIYAFFWQESERLGILVPELQEHYEQQLSYRAAREEEEEDSEIGLNEEERATTLEVKLVNKLTKKKERIDKLEMKLESMQDDLCNRKMALRESILALPPAQRPQWNLKDDTPSTGQERAQCVICQDEAPVQAVVPCGHLCLCEDCAPSLLQRPHSDRLCPLCRGPASSTLRIYS